MKCRHWLLILLFVLSTITFLDRVCISVAGPSIQADLGLGPEQWGWIVGAFSLAYAFFEIPTGMLGDRLGARKVLARIVIWWSAFTVLTGFVRTYPILLVTRFLFGVGEAGAFPNVSGVISRWFPSAERARAQACVWTATRLGAAISPLLLVPVSIAWGWRATFWVCGGAGVAWSVVWLAWYRDNPAELRGISPAELAEVTALAPRVSQHLSLRAAIRHSTLRSIMLMYFCYCYAAYFFISWLHTYLVKGRGFSNRDLALLSTLPFILGAASNMAGGVAGDYLVRRIGPVWGRRGIGIAGLACAGLFVLAATIAPGKWVILFLALAYACSDFMLPSAWAACVDIGREHSGTVSGAMNTAGQLGSFASGVIFGYLVKTFHSYDAPLVVIGVMLLISALQWLRIDAAKELKTTPAAGKEAQYA